MQLVTSPKRIFLLSALAALLGTLAGLAALVLVRLIAVLTNVLLFGTFGWDLPSMSDLEPSPRIVIVAVAGALVVALIARWSPIIKGHGIPEAMESVLSKQSRVAPLTAIAKPLSSAIAIGTGGPFGAEGPIIVTGGSIGSLVGQIVKVSPSERKILLACGAAGGMAATFGAPLASIVLAVELLLFEFSTRAFIPLAVSAAVAGGFHAAFFGSGPLFDVPDHAFAGLSELPLFVPLGLACGLLAVVVSKGLFLVEAGFRRIPVGEFWHPAIGAVGFALVALAVPEVLGVGYDSIELVLAGGLAAGSLAVLGGAKMLAWWLALGSGTSGGTLAPVLLISASFGALFGEAITTVFPDVTVGPGAFALVAMAATFGAATRATLTAIVFVFELTQDYNAILPLILASVLADLIGLWLLPNTLMTEKLARRGLRVPTDMRTDVVTTTPVSTVMSRQVVTLPSDATVGDALASVVQSMHSAFPLVDEQEELAGIISRGDLLEAEAATDAPVMDLARVDVVTVGPDETVAAAGHRMIAEGVDHLPVVDGGRLVGMCTRTDLVRGQGLALRSERRQAGWRPGAATRRQPEDAPRR
jgi:chloride channel protein, CIC family